MLKILMDVLRKEDIIHRSLVRPDRATIGDYKRLLSGFKVPGKRIAPAAWSEASLYSRHPTRYSVRDQAALLSTKYLHDFPAHYHQYIYDEKKKGFFLVKYNPIHPWHHFR